MLLFLCNKQSSLQYTVFRYIEKRREREMEKRKEKKM